MPKKIGGIYIENKITKKRIGIWLDISAIDECDVNLKIADCKTRSEYIQRAVEFYNGYVHTQNNADFVATVISKTLEGLLSTTENRLARLQFKQAVELSKLSAVIAPLCELDSEEMEQLHNRCVSEVKSTNGMMDFTKSVKNFRSGDIPWQ